MKFICLMMALGLILVSIPGQVASKMSSTNYCIPTAVLSGGGAPVSSAKYKMNSTAGQPSPVMDTAGPPYSAGYDLYPGFWYTMDAGPAGCEDLLSFAECKQNKIEKNLWAIKLQGIFFLYLKDHIQGLELSSFSFPSGNSSLFQFCQLSGMKSSPSWQVQSCSLGDFL